MNPLYVGVDASSKSNVVYLMLPDGSKHSSFSVPNSQDESAQMVKRILSALTSHSLDAVTIGLEATSVYGDNLVYFLREDAILAPCNRKIHVLNPRQVKNLKESYNDLPKTVNDSVNQVLSISIASIKALEARIKEFDKAIAAQTELLSNVLISIPGIMGEIGDINRFPSQSQLGKYAGLAWRQHQSGDFEAEDTKQIQSGNRFLKYYLCEGALSLVRCDTEYSNCYRSKYKEVNRHQHKHALPLTARKFVRLVFALLKDNRLYQATE